MVKMSRFTKGMLAAVMLIFGSLGFIIASFNLKHDAAWLSVVIVSVITAIQGILIIDSL